MPGAAPCTAHRVPTSNTGRWRGGLRRRKTGNAMWRVNQAGWRWTKTCRRSAVGPCSPKGGIGNRTWWTHPPPGCKPEASRHQLPGNYGGWKRNHLDDAMRTRGMSRRAAGPRDRKKKDERAQLQGEHWKTTRTRRTRKKTSPRVNTGVIVCCVAGHAYARNLHSGKITL